MSHTGSGSVGGRGLGTSARRGLRGGGRHVVARAASYAVEQLEQRVMLTGVAGPATVDVGVPYTLGLTPGAPDRAGYRVNWGPGEGTSDVPGNATAFPAHTYATAGTYHPVVQALDASNNPIPGTDVPLAFDASFGDRGRVYPSFYHNDLGTWDAHNPPYAVTQQPDGKVLVGGTSDLPDGRSDYLLARLRPDGSLDTAFGTSGKFTASFYATGETPGTSQVYKVALQRNGKILVAGTAFNSQTTGKDLAVARYNPDGSIDPTFGQGGVVRLDLSLGGAVADDVAYDVVVQGDGKIVLAGSTKAATGGTYADFAVVRLSTYGDLDATFGDGGVQRVDVSGASGGDDVARGVTFTPDGKILVGGQAGQAFGLVRLRAGDGALDTTFQGDAGGLGKVVVAMPGSGVEVFGMAAQGDGKVVLTGRTAGPGGGWDYALARFNADGTLDRSLNAAGAVDGGGPAAAGTLRLDLGSADDTPWAVAVQPADGRILLGGHTTRDGQTQGAIVRLNPDGTPDTAFGADGQVVPDAGEVLALGVQADGKVLASALVNGQAAVLRLQPDSALTVTGSATRAGVAVRAHDGQALGQVAEHAPVVIDLDPGTSPGGVAPSRWEVDWGDGQVQTYPGGATTALHVYTGAPNSYQLVATAFDQELRHRATPLVVTVGLDRPSTGDVAILDDGPPTGATEDQSGGTFAWQASDPSPFAGAASLVSGVSTGVQHHWVQDLPSPLTVNAGDVLFGYVWLDPAHPPETIALRWKDETGSWQHGAYWGGETLAGAWGLHEGTAELFPMGRLPQAGGWARLEVPASLVAMEGRSVAGMDFVVTGGRAAFDSAGVNRKPAGPGMPTGLVAFAQGGTQVRLEWRDVAGETKYKVLRSSDGLTFDGIGVVTADSASFTDTHVAPGTRYWYRVDAYNGTAFTRSAVASATTPSRTTGADLAHGLWARYFDNETTTAPAVAQLEQSLDLNWGDASPVPTIRGDHFSAELTGRVTPVHASGTATYTFWVRANTAVRLWVNGQLLIDQAADAPMPGDANRDGTVDFSDLLTLAKNYNGTGKTWAEGDFNGDGLVNFDDLLNLAKNNNKVETPIDYPKGGATPATIQLAAGQSYDVRLQLTDTYGFASARLLWQTPLSGSVRQDVPLAQLTPTFPDAVPAAPVPPTDLAVHVAGPNQVDLGWAGQSADAQGFRIERRVGNSTTWAVAGVVPAGQTTFSDRTVTAGTTYAYRVAAYDATGTSPFAAAEPVTTPAATGDATAPSAVGGLTATYPTANSVRLTWTAATDDVGVAGYEVFRDGVLLGTTTQPSFADSGLDPAKSYTYVVLAFDAAGNRSAQAGLVARTAPPAPTGLYADANFGHQVRLTWADTSTDESGFSVERSADGGKTFAVVATVPANTGTNPLTSYTDGSLPADQQFVYRVRATRAGGAAGAYSATVQARTLGERDVYANDFQGPARPRAQGPDGPGDEWQVVPNSGGTQTVGIATAPAGGGTRRFLGTFHDAEAKLDLHDLPAHGGVTLSFDVYVIGGWDGIPEDGSRFDVEAANAFPNFSTTFSNFPPTEPLATTVFYQAYPGNLADDQHNAPFDHASESLNSLGYTGVFDADQSPDAVPADAVYHITHTFAHSDADLSVTFLGAITGRSDVMFGLDNVRVSVTADTATDLTATAAPDGSIRVRWVDDSQRESGYRLYRRTDGTDFAAIADFPADTTSPTLSYPDTSAQGGRTYYYRVAALVDGKPGAFSNVASATSVPAGMTFTEKVGELMVPVQADDPATPARAVSSFVLEKGVHYQLRATGDFHLGGKYGRADAEFSFPDGSGTAAGSVDNSYAPGNIDYGIGVNDPVTKDPAKDTNKYPDWGLAYDAPDSSTGYPGHTYVVDVVGDGNPISLDYHDDYFKDNTLDTLLVEVFKGSGGPSTSVSGSVWADDNADGQQNGGEQPLAGYQVFADLDADGVLDPGEPAATTAADGTYTIAGLTPGAYDVRVVLPANRRTTQPAKGVYRDVQVWEGQVTTGIGFGVGVNHAPHLDRGPAPSIHLSPYAPKPRQIPGLIWGLGDVLVGTFPDLHTRQYTSAGSPVRTLQQPRLGPVAFNPDGSLWAAEFDLYGSDEQVAKSGMVRRIGPDGSVLATLPQLLDHPEALVTDAFGNVYLGMNGSYWRWTFILRQPGPGIFKFDKDGRLLDQWLTDKRIDHMDLEPDQHTMLYVYDSPQLYDEHVPDADGAKEIYSIDLNTGQTGTFATGLRAAGDLRVLPDGRVLVADMTQVKLLSPQGTVVRTYDVPGVDAWFGLNLDPDGTSFWSADANSGTVARFDIETGALITTFDASVKAKPDDYWRGDASVAYPRTLAIYGEPRAASGVTPREYESDVLASDQDGDTLTYSITGSTAPGAKIDASSGALTIDPDQDGPITVTVRVSDPSGLYDEQPYTILVDHKAAAGTNRDPVITTTALSPAKAGARYTNRVAATDADGDALNYALVDSPGFDIDPGTGAVTWLPTATDQMVGQQQVTVRVTDGRGGSAERTFTVTVLPADPANHAPAFWLNQSPPAAVAGQAFSFVVRFGDPDRSDPPPHFFPVSLPRGMTIRGGPFAESLEVLWTPGFDQVGSHPFTIGLSDGKGGYAQQTFTVDVARPVIPIAGIQVDPTTPADPRSKRLTATTSDPAAPFDGTFAWTVDDAPYGAPPPVIVPQDDWGSSVVATFGAPGVYTFTVTATNSAGQSQPVTARVTVDRVATRLAAVPKALSVQPGQSIDFLKVTTYDQFGGAFTPPTSPAWSLVTNASHGSITAAGVYQAGPDAGVDVLQVTYGTGATAVTDRVRIGVAATALMVGTAATGLVTVEGRNTTFNGSVAPGGGGGGGFLASFYDPAATATAGGYSVVVDWGDGQTSAGTVTASTAAGVPAPFAGHLFDVSATHQYGREGRFPVVVTVTPTGGGDPLVISSEPGSGVLVQSAPVTVRSVRFTAGAGVKFTDRTLATFTDAMSPSAAAEFGATIHWGDGTSSAGTVVAKGDGKYEVRGTHTYAAVGTPAGASVDVFEYVDPVAGGWPDGQTTEVRGSAPLDVTVLSAELRPPRNLTATAVYTVSGDRGVMLDWDREPDAFGYAVFRIDPDGNEVRVDPRALLTPYLDETDPTNTAGGGLKANALYGYKLMESDEFGNLSTPSAVVWVRTFGLPTQPQGLQAATDAADGRAALPVTLTWTAAAGQDVRYDVLRAPGRGRTTAPGQTEFHSLLDGGDPISGAVFYDTTASPSSDYWYEVVTVDPIGGQSPPSAPIRVLTKETAAAPLAPTSLEGGYAGLYGTTRRVGLRWTMPETSGLLGFDVYRDTSADFTPNASNLIGSSRADDHRYTDDLTLPGRVYYYRVKAVSREGDGGEVSSEATAAVAVDTTADDPQAAPAAPTDLAVAQPVAADHVTLTWVDASLNESEFDVYRRDVDRDPPGRGTQVGRVTADAQSFTDTTVVPGVSYVYTVVAHNRLGDSADVTVPAPTAGQKASVVPTGLHVTSVTYDQATLGWSAPAAADGFTLKGYYLYRRTAGGFFARVTPELLTGTTFTDAGLDAGTTYTYQVRAVWTTGAQSDASDTADAVTPAAPLVRPEVRITSPAPFAGVDLNVKMDSVRDDRIRKVTPIEITVDDANAPAGGDGAAEITRWELRLRPANRTAVGFFTADGLLLRSGSGRVGSRHDASGKAVFSLDPTLYPSGQYELVLTAVDKDGKAAVPAVVPVSLYSETKIGNLSLPAVDLTFDVPGGQPLTVRRVYDSGRADELLDFGYGWRLDTSDTALTTTAKPSATDDGVTLRQGDLVYVTVPGGVQHAFQFWPVPNNYDGSLGLDPYGPGYAHYWAQFVAVDGSNATLTVEGDMHADQDERVDLVYDKETGEFRGLGLNGYTGEYAYNPASGAFGNRYTVTEADGTVYDINATSGKISTATDPNGNQTRYTDNGVTTSAGTFSLRYSKDNGGPISSVYVVASNGNTVGPSVTYTYAGGRLTEAASTQNGSTKYEYNDPNHPNYLTAVIDSRNVATLRATYTATGQLDQLLDAHGNAVDASTPTSDGSRGSEAVTDLSPDKNTTENVYDDHGDVIRQIRSFKDDAGNVSYQVTVSDYSYFDGGPLAELSDLFDWGADKPGVSSQNALLSSREYAPFIVDAAHAAERYTRMPTEVRHEVLYNDLDSAGVAGRRLPSVEYTYLDQAADSNSHWRRVTLYGGYDHGKPTSVTTRLEVEDTPDHWATRGTPQTTYFRYDAHGNLTHQFDTQGQGTEYEYTPSGDGLPAGLLLRTYKVRLADLTKPNGTWLRLTATGGWRAPQAGDVPAMYFLASENEYYRTTDVETGALAGQVRVSRTAGGRPTYYTYDAAGRVLSSYYLWVNPDAGQPNRWVVTRNEYDGAGRPTGTWEATYLDGQLVNGQPGKAGELDLVRNYNHALVIGEMPYRAERQDSGTSYDAAGRVTRTQDQFGAGTTNTYDADGNLIRVTYPDSTDTLTVYDAMGRVEWATDRAFVGSSNRLATHTVYDALGRVVRTERYKDTHILLENQTVAGANGTTLTIEGTSLTSRGTALSAEVTVYDAQGRAIEADRVKPVPDTRPGHAGEFVDQVYARTGTVYYADGRVRYAGPLKADRDNWDGIDMTAFQSYTTYLYDQVGDGGLVYDRVIDARGHHTDTYKDLPGGATHTVFDDGTFAESFQGVAGQLAATKTSDGRDIPTPPGLAALLADTDHVGWRHEVRIAQRKKYDDANQNDPDARVLATHYLYDAAGRLREVWLPPVKNAAKPGSPVEWPHWSYGYDANGNQVSQTDPNGHATTFAYDERGLRTRRTLPGLEHEDWIYDDYGRLVTHADFKGQTTAFKYGTSEETAGRVDDEYRFEAGTAALNTDGSIATAAAAERTHYHYDDLGRVDTVDEYDGAHEARETATAFDPITGGVTRVTQFRADASGDPLTIESVVHHRYDPTTGLLAETWTGLSDDPAVSTADPAQVTTDTLYGYDDQGRLKSVTSHRVNGATPLDMAAARDQYDALGDKLSPTREPTTLYVYDGVGNLDAVLLPNGVTSDYAYDDLNRLTHLEQFTDADGNLVLDTGGDVKASFDYHLNADGTRKDATEVDDQGHTTTLNWRYDADGRLVAETRDASDSTGDDYIATYAYDLNGNRLQYRIIDEPTSADIVAFLSPTPPTFNADRTIAYEYNEDDQLWRETSTGTEAYQTLYGHFDPQDASVFYKGYDANGSLVEKVRTGAGAESDSYGYDLRNRLTSATVNDHALVYDYDSAGNRVTKSKDGQVVRFVVDDANPTGYSQVLEEHDGATDELRTTYVIGADVIGQARAANATSPDVLEYLLYDGHGSTRGLLDAAGVVQQKYDYDAFGVALATNPATPLTSLLYTGEYWDGEKTSYFLRGRESYDPAIGRFYRSDPFVGINADPRTLHKYLYVEANPINLVDPSGHLGLADTLVVTGIGGLIGAITIGGIHGIVSWKHGAGFWNGVMKGSVEGAIIGSSLTLAALTGGPGQVVKAIATGAFEGFLNLLSKAMSEQAVGKNAEKYPLSQAFLDGFAGGVAKVGWGGFIGDKLEVGITENNSSWSKLFSAASINAGVSSLAAGLTDLMDGLTDSDKTVREAFAHAIMTGVVNALLSVGGDSAVSLQHFIRGTEGPILEVFAEALGGLFSVPAANLLNNSGHK